MYQKGTQERARPSFNPYRIYGLNSFKHKLNATDPRNIFELENDLERIIEIAGERIPSRSILIFFLTNYFNAKSVISWVHAPVGFLEMTGSEPPASKVDTVLS